MAKHTTGKFVSKGQRKSCNKLRKAPGAVGETSIAVSSVMREAFARADYGNASGELVGKVVNALTAGVGIHRKSRGWQAEVTAHTAKKLVKEGVFA